MTDKNDVLLKQFFQDAATQQIADKGFSERVMQHLPERAPFIVAHRKLFTRLWTCCCVLLFSVLFVLIDGWDLLSVQFEVMLRTMAVQTISVNLLVAATILFGLLFVGVGEVISSETART